MPPPRSSLFATTGVGKPKTPTSLRVEHLENALGIDEKQPRLSWIDQGQKSVSGFTQIAAAESVRAVRASEEPPFSSPAPGGECEYAAALGS
jgi:hypothetical protein